MKLHSNKSRVLFFLGFVTCIVLLATGAYLQFVLHLAPCPLCVMQRIAFILIAITYAVALIHGPSTHTGINIYCGFTFIWALLGVGLASRHIWLQLHPETLLTSCGPDLGYLLKTLPISESIKLLFTGSGECGKIDWRFLGLTIPMWSLLWFGFFALVSLFACKRRCA